MLEYTALCGTRVGRGSLLPVQPGFDCEGAGSGGGWLFLEVHGACCALTNEKKPHTHLTNFSNDVVRSQIEM